MKKVLLVTRPNYDDATSYLFYYAKKIIDCAREKNTRVLDLIRPRLTKQIGNSAQEVFDKSTNMSKKNILRLLRIKGEPGAMASIMLLWSNIEGQDILGDKDIRFG